MNATDKPTVPVDTLLALFGAERSELPAIAQLNQWARQWQTHWQGPQFVAEQSVELTNRYYEVFIAEEQKVPTREHNWHDAYNALMWIVFPRAKQLLNQWHCDEIARFGVHPRSPRRNRLTHFDECGVVIAVPEGQLEAANDCLQQLANHQWQKVFIDSQQVWGELLHPAIFGHALYEMLMAPFIGLTGKWLAVVVPAEFAAQSIQQQYAMLDEALVKRLTLFDGLADKRTLKPLPLLGVPGWYHQQTAAFYSNTDYFRPLTQNAPATNQLPLTTVN
ncbi:DUF3025 domain-containing protein [Alteromonas gilva]|uniref:DUF3025 domain-containing protein n=1 Tax=Alteromonas gilva TaxID=2987522 RepID=A0ABT5L3J2_9ALTE|nr:DUF3025 domain-containing protein [Alteromonas gilva]MDC8831603.1 DUF3025 domain-containing protein [Alteromonas gilva]